MDLTVLIPTRNRASHLGLLINSLQTYLAKAEIEWEIVVSNNHSKDDTAALLEAINERDSRIRTVSPERPLETAEENLCFGVCQAKGEYIWLLGDDDIPEGPGVYALFEAINKRSYDFIVFNSRGIDNSGEIYSAQRIPCIGKTWETTIDSFIVHQGFMYTLAGFSICILRRKYFDPKIFDEYCAISPIYSHVTTFVDCFSGRPMLFVNLPLVRYRRNQYAEGQKGHWESVAERAGKFEKFFWTIGFIRQVEHLISRGKLSYEHIYYSIEQSDTDRFRLIYYIAFMMSLQLKIEVGNNPIKIRVTREELIEFRDFFLRTVPEEWPIINCFSRLIALPSIGEAKDQARGITARLVEILSALSSKSLSEQFYLGVVDRKPLYHHAWTTFSPLPDRPGQPLRILADKAAGIMKYIDYIDAGPIEILADVIPQSFIDNRKQTALVSGIKEIPIAGPYGDKPPSADSVRSLTNEPLARKIARKALKKIVRILKAAAKRILR